MVEEWNFDLGEELHAPVRSSAQQAGDIDRTIEMLVIPPEDEGWVKEAESKPRNLELYRLNLTKEVLDDEQKLHHIVSLMQRGPEDLTEEEKSEILEALTVSSQPAFQVRLDEKSRLGRGGFGEVHKIQDPQSERVLALKIPKPTQFESSRSERAKNFISFWTEAYAASLISQGRVLTQEGEKYYPEVDEAIVDIEEIVMTQNGEVAIVMEYLGEPWQTGERLLERNAEWIGNLKRLKRPAENWDYFSENLQLLQNMAKTLDRLHTVADAVGDPVVDGDIKLQNYFFDLDTLKSKRIDFGITSIAKKRVAPAEVPGTEAYQGPEAIELSQEGGVRPQSSDLYAFSLVAIEILTGQDIMSLRNWTESTPFNQRAAGLVLGEWGLRQGKEGPVLRQAKQILEPLMPFGSPQLEKVAVVLRTALHADPKQRYQTAQEMVFALQKALLSES